MPLMPALQQYILHQKGDFNHLALESFTYQYECCEPYQRYCQQLKISPDHIKDWTEIPAVSTETFREQALCTFPKNDATRIFYTSGTTQEKKGAHYYQDLSLYQAAIHASFCQALKLKPQDKTIFRVLTPSSYAEPHSSLFYMFQTILTWYGSDASRFYFKNNELDAAALTADLEKDIKAKRPVVLLGTAFSFINYFAYLDQHSLQLTLPSGSKLLETGGLKGRSRAVSKTELYQLFESHLGLPQDACFSEYGMTELSSQCYSQPSSFLFNTPHWMKVRIINPRSGEALPSGEVGLVQFFDLANFTTVSALLTQDLARQNDQGFELLGRAPDAPLRGCSLPFEA